MLYVRYDKKRDVHRLRVKGHAGYARKGEDIVCAACSILAYTLGQNARDLEKSRIVEVNRCAIEEGEAAIDFAVIDRSKEAVVQLVMDSILRGYELLASNFPENVQYCRQRGEKAKPRSYNQDDTSDRR